MAPIIITTYRDIIVYINDLIEKYDRLKSDHNTFVKHNEKVWKKENTESFYIPYYHRGEIGFQYIPKNYVLGVYLYPDTEFRDKGDIKGFVLM